MSWESVIPSTCTTAWRKSQRLNIGMKHCHASQAMVRYRQRDNVIVDPKTLYLVSLSLLNSSIVSCSAIFSPMTNPCTAPRYISPLAWRGKFQACHFGLDYVQHLPPPDCRQSMSILGQAFRHSRSLQEPVYSRIAALAQSQLTCSVASELQQRSLTGSSSCHSPVHIEDEPYCRQRQLIVLGNRVPELAPDSWVAPNAVIIGD